MDLGLDPGETAAILLAEEMSADALLIDGRRGRSVAAGPGIAVIGTLGVLAGAKRAGALERAAPSSRSSEPTASGWPTHSWSSSYDGSGNDRKW